MGQEHDPHGRREVRGRRRGGAGIARRSAIAAVFLLALLPAGARADGLPRTDPEVGTPSESVYGIPLEEARRDGAPQVMPGSATRTENAVGSSATVPGRGEPAQPETPAEERRLRERRQERRRQAAQAVRQLSGEPSTVATGALIVLLVAIAGAGGVATGRLAGPRGRL